GPAPAGGITVAISTDSPNVVQVPATVTVPAGQSQVNFTFTTSAVTSTTGVAIVETYNGVVRYVSPCVVPAGVILSWAASSASSERKVKGISICPAVRSSALRE